MRYLLIGLIGCFGISIFAATPLTESTFTEIIRDVNVVGASTKKATPAKTNEVFKAPDMVRTGSSSRVEMTAPDKSITRIGANTVFTFEDERNLRLQKGSILFHSPAGMGGGAVKNRGTAAAVLGTTMICAVMSDGSFKILDLEGHILVTLVNGRTNILNPGDMLIVSPDGETSSAVTQFNLGEVVGQLELVAGFSNPLSSLPLIAEAIKAQNALIASGQAGPFAPFWVVVDGIEVIHGGGGGFPPWIQLYDRTLLELSPNTPK